MSAINSTRTDMVRSRLRGRARRFPFGALGEMILLTACIVPGLIFSYSSLQSPWNEFKIARAAISVHEEKLSTFVTAASGYRSEHSGIDLMLATIVQTSAWSLESISLLPIGSLLLAVLYYAIARKVTQSPWTAAAITLYASWYYPRLVTQYATHGYAWTNALFLTFLILLWYQLRHRTRTLSLLIMVVFIAVFLFYHTTPLWVITALAVAAMLARLKGNTDRQYLRAATWALALFCAVLYFAFDTVVYGNALARIRTGEFTEGWFLSLTSRIVAPLFGNTPDVLEPFVIGQISPRLATWSTALIFLMLTIPVGIWCLFRVYEMVRARQIAMVVSDVDDLFCWTVVAAMVVHAVTYSLYGSISLRVVPLAFPLIVPLVLKEFKLAKAIEVVSAWILAGLAIVGFLGYTPALQPDILASETGLAYELFTPEDRLLADTNTYSSLLMASAAQGNTIGFVWPSPATYAAVTGQQTVDPEVFDYFVWDSSNKPIITLGWILLEPWTQHWQQIVQNPDLDKVYDSEKLMIFRPTGLGAPAHSVVTQDIPVGARSVWRDALRLFVSFIILFVVPGGVLSFILHDASLFTPEPTPTLFGLAVGLSIVFLTFLGYAVNFSPLGLRWYIPLCILLPWAFLTAYLVMRRRPFRPEPRTIMYVLTMLATMLLWALSATWIAHVRTENHRLQTEFFATQTEPQASSLDITAVNRSKNARTFTISFESDGVRYQSFGPRLVPPNSIWTETWDIPPDLLQKRLCILLEEDGNPTHELGIHLQ